MDSKMWQFLDREYAKLNNRNLSLLQCSFIEQGKKVLKMTLEESYNEFTPEFVANVQSGLNIIVTSLKMLSSKEELDKAAEV